MGKLMCSFQLAAEYKIWKWTQNYAVFFYLSKIIQYEKEERKSQ